MTAKEYKKFKGLKKENLRDNMTNKELVLNMLAELSTKEISESKQPETFNEHINIAKAGGEVARNARLELEQKTGKAVISPLNAKNGIVFNSGIDSDAVDTGFPDGILEILQVRSILEKIQKDIFFIAVAQFHSVQSLIDPPVIKINPDMRGRQKSVGFRDKSIGMKLQSVFQCFFIRTQNVQRRLPAAFGILFHVIVIIASHVSDPFFYQLSSALRSQGFQKVVL